MAISDADAQKIAVAVVTFQTHYSAPVGSVSLQGELINLRRKTDALLAGQAAAQAAYKAVASGTTDMAAVEKAAERGAAAALRDMTLKVV